MYYNTAKHGTTKSPFQSDHAVSITNTTGSTKTYHITYWNGIMFTAPWYSPLAEKEFDVTVANGQTVTYPTERIVLRADVSMAGNYSTQAITQVKLDGKYIAYCENYNKAYIF